MERTTDPLKLAAEERFPHKVDVAVPIEGLGDRLHLMRDWCYDNIAAADWDEHEHSVPTAGETPTRYARFYFMRADDADAFRQRWATPGWDRD
jgi:hypothetical protein